MTNEPEAPDRRVTFQGETSKTSDVVLCDYCGGTLHAPEHDVFWSQTKLHYCEPAKDARIAELEALVHKLASDPDYTAAYVAGVADQKATIAELEAKLAKVSESLEDVSADYNDAHREKLELEKMIDNMTAHIRIDPDE